MHLKAQSNYLRNESSNAKRPLDTNIFYNDMPTKNDVAFNTAIISTNNLTWKLTEMSAPVNGKTIIIFSILTKQVSFNILWSSINIKHFNT